MWSYIAGGVLRVKDGVVLDAYGAGRHLYGLH